MIFEATDLESVFLIKPERIVDERGSFARTFCTQVFAENGLVSSFAQQSVSLNIRRGTTRGLHFQAAPDAETKVVRCIRGSVFDVAVDLRSGSRTFRKWFAVNLSGENGWSLYVPAGVAHGFQTLADDTEVEYLITPAYVPSSSRGVAWDDPSLGIDWPIKSGITISERDRNLPTVEDFLCSN